MKKIIVLLIAVTLVFSLAACSGPRVAKIGDKIVTTVDIKTQLDEAQKEILKTYAYENLIEKFYVNAVVSDSEVQTKVVQIKGQYSDTDWAQYLTYYGYKDDADFVKATKRNMQREQKLADVRKTITFTDADAEKEFNNNLTYYQYAEVDAVFFQDKETKDKAWKLIQDGKTLDEAAKETSTTVSKNEKAPITFEEFTNTFDKSKVGDIMQTKDTSSTFIIAKINKLNLTFNDVKEVVKTDYIAKASSIVLDQQIKDFFKNTSVEIMGEKIDTTTLIKSTTPDVTQ